MEDYYEYLDSNGVTTLYKLIKDDTVALIDSYSVTLNGITTTLDTHINDSDIHTPITDIENMIGTAIGNLNYATPDYVDTKISGLVNSAPETLDTLKELSDALGNDPNFATTIVNQIGTKAAKDSVYTKQETDTLLEGKANSVHNHVVSDITDFPTIPTKLSQLENDMGFGTGGGSGDTSISWTNITDKPSFSDIAISGSYNDLVDTPNIPTKTSDLTNDSGYITSVNWGDITSKPVLSQVAISGSYSDLSGTPTIPTKTSQLINDSGFLTSSSGVITSVSWSDITNKPNFSTVATSGSYTDLSNTPIIPTKLSDLSNDSGFAIDNKVVHKTGNETIDGIKSFSNDIRISKASPFCNVFSSGYIKGQAPTSNIYSGVRFFDDINSGSTNTITGGFEIEYNRDGYNRSYISSRNYAGETHKFFTVGLRVPNDDTRSVDFLPSVNAIVNLGTSSYKWADVNTVLLNGKIPAYIDDVTSKANDSDAVHKSGDENISGNKFFTQDVNVKNSDVDIAVTPSNNLFSCFRFRGKGNVTTASIQYSQRTYGVNDICFYVFDASSNSHGFRIRTDNILEPIENNTYSLGSPNNKWANVYATTFNGNLNGNADTATSANDPNAVHRSGNETISGNKTFTNQMYMGSGGTSYGQISAKDNNSILRLFGGTSAGTGANLDLYGEGLNSGGFSLRARTSDKIIGLDGKVDGTLKWNGKNVALDDNLVHRSGDEIIKGVKYFDSLVYLHNNMANKNSQMDLFTTPANMLYSHYMFVDKNDEVCAYMQYGQHKYGNDFIGLFIHDKNRASHGIQVTTNNEVIPITNNAYSLGSPNNIWKNVYATTFNGNLKGNADTATYATTQATSDNSTKIATTAWVRNYVNSVVGSSAVSSSISAYYSNAAIVTAIGTDTSNTAVYPADFSNYIDISPKVGTIYTGSQLFSALTPTASGTIKKDYTSSGTPIYNTTAKATATFSGAFSASAKYLCTTANAVKFRVYVDLGTPSSMGAASIVDQSISKSIFIRVE